MSGNLQTKHEPPAPEMLARWIGRDPRRRSQKKIALGVECDSSLINRLINRKRPPHTIQARHAWGIQEFTGGEVPFWAWFLLRDPVA